MVLVLRILAIGTGEVESIAERRGLAGSDVRDSNGVISSRWTDVCRDGQVDRGVKLGGVDKIAYKM